MDLITGTQALEQLLNFSPVLVAAFAGLGMLFVQTLKNLHPWFKDHAILANLISSIGFSALVVFNVTWALQMSIITYLIMTMASGIYSGSKNKVDINFSDME